MTEHDIFAIIVCVVSISYIRMRSTEQVGGDVTSNFCARSVVTSV